MSDRPVDTGASRPWIIVGYGRVGQSLTLLADRLGATVGATWNRTEGATKNAAVPSPNPRWGDLPDALKQDLVDPCLVWLTVVDEAIEPVFENIAPHIPSDSLVVHTSGSIPSTVLANHSNLPTASLHPLQAISEPQTAVERFDRTFWTIEGDDEAVDIIRHLVAPADIDPTRIKPHKKTLYHASAVTAANLLVSLLDAAISIAQGADIAPSSARQMLVELAGSSLENLTAQSPAQALTGPAARGDLEIIESHRQALQSLDDESLLQIYDALTERALQKLAR